MLSNIGASNGITKNFETVREVLKDFVTVRDPGKAPAVKVCSLYSAGTDVHMCLAVSTCAIL